MWANAQLHSHLRGAVLTEAVSSSNRSTLKLNTRVACCHTAEVISIQTFTCHTLCPKEQPISAVSGGIPNVFGMDVVA